MAFEHSNTLGYNNSLKRRLKNISIIVRGALE